MMSKTDPFHHHPELRNLITDPLKSFFRDFHIQQLVRENPELQWVLNHVHSTDAREDNRKQTLKRLPDGDLWVFAYGSLMWDPALQFAEIRRAHVPDYARRFILKDIMGGRGTQEAPGLMAALDEGDGCEGLIFRIPSDQIDVETEILWRREMVAPGYHPTLVDARCEDETLKALTFTADHDALLICADITREEQIDYLCTGKGLLGTSFEYLANIVSQFDALGVKDPHCQDLLEQAKRAMAAA